MAGSTRNAVKRASQIPSTTNTSRRLASCTPVKVPSSPQDLRPPPPQWKSSPAASRRAIPEELKRQQDFKTFFDATGVLWSGGIGDKPPPDPNKAKLGKTLRILQDRLPTLLQSPLPQEILAPNICLHLFPSTHPHLPAVSGRVAYNAALWTSPIAWNRMPLIGNVRLEILAERMTAEPLTFLPRRPGVIPEQLVVRWREKCRGESSSTHSSSSVSGGAGGGDSSIANGIGQASPTAQGVDPDKAFTGLFIFDFDEEGRVLTHTIEHAQEGGDWEKGMGAKVVGLTDWLLGGMRDPGETPIPMFEGIKKRRP